MKKTDKVSHEIHGTGTIIDTHLGLGFAYVEFGFDSIWVKFEELTALSAASEVEGEVMYKAGDWVVTDKGKVRQIDHILAVPVGHNCTVALKGEMYPTNSTRWKYFQASFLNRYVPSVGEYVVIESNISDTGVNGCNDQPFHYVGRLGKVTAIEDTERYPNSKWISIDNHFAAITSNQIRPATDAEIAATCMADGMIDFKDKVKHIHEVATPVYDHPALIPFDLEKALSGSKVVTREGRNVDEIVYLDTLSEGIAGRVYAVIDGEPYNYTKHGVWMGNTSRVNDLFLAPEEKVAFVNVSRNAMGFEFDTLQEAIDCTSDISLCILQFKTIGDRTEVSIAHTY